MAFDRFGDPDVLAVTALPLPDPGVRQVRVRVHAAAVNPTDTVFRAGLGYAAQVGHPAPWIAGMDFAGTVDQPGDGSRWSPGTRVLGIAMPSGSRQGAYADYVVVPDDALAAAPPEASFAEASTVAMNGLTALRAIDLLRERGATTVGVTGAAGAVGGLAIELASDLGLRVVADASEADRELVAGFGATMVLPRGQGWAAAVRSAFPDGIDALIDGAVSGPHVLSAVKDGGTVAAVRSEPPLPAERGIEVTAIQMVDYYRRADKLEQLARAAAAGTITMRVAQVLAPDEAPEAHRRLASGGTRGRLVLDFS
ncbi:MAG: NADP-dependent oxidoreductase [Aeromicrobium sp.]